MHPKFELVRPIPNVLARGGQMRSYLSLRYVCLPCSYAERIGLHLGVIFSPRRVAFQRR